jgi:hypothetical protein
VSARPLPPPVNPALLQHAKQRRQSLENRIADQITPLRRVNVVRLPPHHLVRLMDRLAGRALPVRPADDDRVAGGDLFVDVCDDQPEPRRRKRQVLADHQWQTVQDEEQQNEDLLQVSNQILELTRATHAMTAARAPAGPTQPDGA